MLTGLFFQIGINLLMLSLVGLIYYLIRKRWVYLVTSFLIGLTTFSLVYILGKNEFGLATGIGLFAIFGIIRYRTEQVPIIEMTYIFVCITISLVDAIADELTVTLQTALSINTVLIICTGLLFYFNQKRERVKLMLLIDSIDWLSTDESARLKFLSTKSFKEIIDYEVTFIDHLKEVCDVVVYHK